MQLKSIQTACHVPRFLKSNITVLTRFPQLENPKRFLYFIMPNDFFIYIRVNSRKFYMVTV